MASLASKGGGGSRIGGGGGSELQVRGGGVMVQGLRKWPKDHGRDECSPERTKVWTEPPPKLKSNVSNNNNNMSAVAAESSKKVVAVVYYLCRNGQLEHPHFIQVPLSPSSSSGLFLRDVINRLNVLRGKGMASQYSWSSKRSYKNGYVWQDLDENDLIQPVHGHEYVLKGSEIFFQQTPSSSSSSTIIPAAAAASSSSNSAEKQQYQLIHNTHDDEESDFPIIIRDGIVGTPQHHDNSRFFYNNNNNNRRRNQSWSSSEYKVYKTDPNSLLSSEFSTSKAAGADAATQTDDKRRRRRTPPAVQVDEIEQGDPNQAVGHPATAGVLEHKQGQEEIQQQQQQSTELRSEDISPPQSDSSPETLETLMKADGRLILSSTNPLHLHHQPPPPPPPLALATTTTTTNQPANSSTAAADDEGFQNLPTNGKMKASSVLMSLFTCGSISFRDCGAAAVKDHGLSLVSSSNSHYIKAPRLFPRSGAGGGSLNQLQMEDNSRTIESGSSSSFRKMVLEDREYFSGSLLVDDKNNKGDEFVPSTSTSTTSVLFKRSSSYNADRSSHLKLEEKELDGVKAKCLPRKPKTSTHHKQQQPPPPPNKKEELMTCCLTTNSTSQYDNNADQVTDAPR